MSDRLAISSAFSVLLMSAYVLFGGNAAQVWRDQPSAMMSQVAGPDILPQIMVRQAR